MKAGDIILEEEPYCHVLLQKQKGVRCDRCFTREEGLKRCTGCGTVYYCDRTCQKRDWATHKKECQCMKKVSPKTPVDSVRLLLRIIISLDLGLPMNSPFSRKFADLMTHKDEIKADETRAAQFTQVAYTLKEYAADIVPLPSASTLFEIFCKMMINCFTITDEVLDHIGTGVYLSGSMLDHSCCPNAVATFLGNTLVVRAITDISDPSPNKVYISYIDQLSITEERQHQLKEQYYFQCHCNKCKDTNLNKQMQRICCPVCKGLIDFTTENLEENQCSKCGTISKSHVHKVNQLLQRCKEHIGSLEADTNEDSKILLQKSESLLRDVDGSIPVSNIYHMRLLDKMMLIAIDAQEWEKALEFGCKTLEPYRLCNCPGLSLNYAIQLYKIGKLQLYMQRLEEARRNLCQAETILSCIYKQDVNRSPMFMELKNLIRQSEEELRVRLEQSQ